MNTKTWLLALSAALATITAHAQAQSAANWPTKPITLVIPFAPGGVSDVIFRALGRELSETFGQPVIIDSRAGAGGTIAATFVANAAPDGYTLIQTNPTMMGVAPRLAKRVSYDPYKSFTQIGTVVTTPNVVVVNNESPIHKIADIVDISKKSGEPPLTYASAGLGSSGHLSGHVLARAMGVSMTHLPYKSSVLAFPDVISGRVSMVFDSMPSTITYIKSGQLRPVVVMSKERSPLIPDVQTAAEAGFPSATLTFWLGLEGPANMPQPIVDKLNAGIAKALKSKDFAELLKTVGADPYPTSPAAFKDMRTADLDRLAGLIKEMNLTAE